MTVKEHILALLDSNKGEYFSGEDIAGRLSVTRSAVWKAIKALQSDGYSIQAVTNKGYSLSPRRTFCPPPQLPNIWMPGAEAAA